MSGKWQLLIHVGTWSPSPRPHAVTPSLDLVSLPTLPPAPSFLRRGEEIRGSTHTGPGTPLSSWRTPAPGPPPAARALWPPWSRAGSGDPSAQRMCHVSQEDAFIPLCLYRYSGFCLFGDSPPLWLWPHLLFPEQDWEAPIGSSS